MGATRFKSVEKGKLRRAAYRKCQTIDSWDRCVARYGVELRRTQDEKHRLIFIEKLVKKVTADTPPMYKAAGQEFGTVHRKELQGARGPSASHRHAETH